MSQVSIANPSLKQSFQNLRITEEKPFVLLHIFGCILAEQTWKKTT